ncbi:MAG: hypothetical protein RIB32_01670 [Phycisphaerales bacterium]
MSDWVLLAHAGATWFMAGLIWFVQVVHYPLMGAVGRDGFAAYEARHQARTTIVVAPAMLIELITGALVTIERPGDPVVIAAGALLVGNWFSTAAMQVPCHRRLESGFDALAHRRLVATNWARTAMWSARAVLVAWLVAGS